jgi:predicted nucleic acid-binding protein
MSARQALVKLSAFTGETEIAISVITLMEMAHGLARANSPVREAARQQFLADVIQAIPIYPITNQIALSAGRLDGENTSRGIGLAISDLLIGVTALDVGFSILTSNVRHFQLIPGLTVIPL